MVAFAHGSRCSDKCGDCETHSEWEERFLLQPARELREALVDVDISVIAN